MMRNALAALTLLIVASISFGCSSKNSSANTNITTPTTDPSQSAVTMTADKYQAQPTSTAQANPFNPMPDSSSGLEPEMEPLSAEPTATPVSMPVGSSVADSSQQFSVDNLPDVIMINTNTIEKSTLSTQPLMEYLRITGLRLGKDGKTVHFNIENAFNRTNAKAIHTGGLMLTAQVRYDYDNGAQAHNCVLFKEKRIIFQKGSNAFQTDPSTYAHVTKVEKLQFFFIPTKTMKPAVAANAPKLPDTSLQFSTKDLPSLVVVDPYTIEQHSQGKDPRLGYLKIRNMKMDGTVFNFAIENAFDRQEAEPIHVGGIMVTGMARYDYDNGAALHSCILFETKHATLEQGLSNFSSDPSLYPGVRSIENIQFYLTP